MAGSTYTIIASQSLRSPRQFWRPGIRQAPWLALSSIIVILACIVASICIITISDKKQTASWKIQPAVLLAIVSSVANLFYAIGLARGISITWWRSALHGTSIKTLHYIWNYGHGGYFRPTVSGLGAYKIALATLVITVGSLVSNPMLQRSTHYLNTDVVTHVTMFLDIPTQIQNGFSGMVQSAAPGQTVINSGFLSAIQDWYVGNTIYTWDDPSYYCNGTCEGYVPSPGINVECNSRSEIINFQDPNNNGALMFSVNFTRFANASNIPVLGMDILFTTAVDSDCNANITIETCNITTAIIKVPVTIQNDTVAINWTKSVLFDSPYTSPADLPTAPDGSPAGPLAGLDWLATYYFASNATLHNNFSQYQYWPIGTLARQFFDTDPSTYKSLGTCGFQWWDPTMYIIQAMGEVLFRAGLTEVLDAGITQTFNATQTTPTLMFHSNYAYLSGAVAIMILALLAMIFPLWGWWELGREVTLSPIETAKAFGAPSLQQASLDMGAEGLVREVGETRVKYGGVQVPDENGLMSPRMEIGSPEMVRKPYRGEGFGCSPHHESTFPPQYGKGEVIEQISSQEPGSPVSRLRTAETGLDSVVEDVNDSGRDGGH